MKLKKNALQQIELAITHRFEEVIAAYNQADNAKVVELMQRGLLSYEDIVEPSNLSLEDEFWSCFSINEKQLRQSELIKILEYIQANKMAAAMNEVATIKNRCFISDTSTLRVFSLIEDFLNNHEEYEK